MPFSASDTPLPGFAYRLKRARRAAQMKQADLATRMGVDQTTVSRWESGAQQPDSALQQQILSLFAIPAPNDFALKRLVQSSRDSVHLVDEASHTCLAYSDKRALEWKTTPSALLGVSLWRFATDEIREEEASLADTDWWSVAMPDPRLFQTSAVEHEELIISEGWIRWERLYLSDGTPVRLVSSA